MATAGEMIQAGDIEGVSHQYERGGRGSAGWEDARTYLEQRHPGSNPRSIDAVIDRAQQVVRIGNRYRQGNPDYAPPASDIPDVRPLERSGGGSGRASKYIHVFIIRMRPQGDANAGPVYIRVRHESSTILSRAEFEALAEDAAQRFNDTFQAQSGPQTGQPRLTPEIRIEGIYRGF